MYGVDRRALALLACLLFTPWSAAEVTIHLTDVAAPKLEHNLRARLALNAEPCDAPSWRVRRMFDQAERDFEPALRAFGHYRAQIDKRLDLDADEACWRANFRIDPGPRVKIRKRVVDVQGDAAEDPELKALIESLPLPVGTPLHHGEYEAIKTRLQDFALDHGYLDFALTESTLRVFPDRGVADISIAAQSGPRYRFGELRLSDTPLDDAFMRRLMDMRPGDEYDAGKLLALDRQLSDTGYFGRVEVRARREQRKDGEVPVDVELDAMARHAWRAGIGFATDTGPRASLRYDNRFVNPQGHRFESELRLSPVESGLTADYAVPGRNPRRETFSFGGGLLHEDNDESVESDSISLVGRQTIKGDKWTQTRFLELLYERSDVGEDRVESTLLMPGLGLDRVKADNLLRTRRGYRIGFEARAAHEALLSDATLLQLRVNAKGIYRFDGAGRITARVNAGTTLGDGIGDLPASLRFFAGGDNSVRGYAYQALGPLDDNGDVAGGRHLLTASLEYEHPVFGEDWWAAVFADGGNAFDTDRISLRAGYGIGVRWYSPVGRIRLDLAIPDDTADDDWRLHFGLGADL